MKKDFNVGDTVKLKSFISTPFVSFVPSMKNQIGKICKITVMDKQRNRAAINISDFFWDLSAFEHFNPISEGDKVVVGNRQNSLKDEKYVYVSQEGDMHIVKNPVGFKAFKFVEKQE